MINTRLVLAVVAVACVAFPLHAQQLPEAPKGYTWKLIDEVNAAFLIPDGWHFKEKPKDDSLRYLITKENIDEKGWHDTGLTINVTPKMQDKGAVGYAKSFVKRMSRVNQPIKTWDYKRGVFRLFGCLTRNSADKGRVQFMMHTVAIANERTNTLFIMWFEGLERTWEADWKIGKTMMDHILLDDDT